jgi:hypothetical protein
MLHPHAAKPTRSTGRPVEGVRTPAAPQSTPKGHSHLPEEGHTSQASNIPIFALGDQDAYYNVSSATVTQAPAQLLPVESLVLCPAFDPAFPFLTECPLGAACRHVHVDVTGLPLIEVHVNYAWRSLEDVAYPRHEAGSTVQVAPPNSLQAIDMIETGCLLRTRALSAGRRPLSHCAHYYFNRQCNLGGECRFVHAVFIDPCASDTLKRAPAPVQIGRYTPSAKDLAQGRNHTDRSPSFPSGAASPADLSRERHPLEGGAMCAPASRGHTPIFAMVTPNRPSAVTTPMELSATRRFPQRPSAMIV